MLIRKKIKKISSASSADISELPEGEEVIVGGIIINLKQTTTKRGAPMLYITLEDMKGTVECLAFSKEMKTYQPLLNIDEIVFYKRAGWFPEHNATLRVKEIIAERRTKASGKMRNYPS